MSELTTLKNIGKEIERKLKIIGINSADDLIKTGSKEAFFQLKLRFPEVCLVHLYTLQGAINNIDYNDLPEKTKKDLKEFSDGFKS